MNRGFGWVEVAHGHTMDDLHRAARIAVAIARTSGADVEWRYQIAWSAIAEAVWTAETPPSARDLVHVGTAAIDAEMRREPHHHGYRREDIGGGVSSRASVYWWEFGRSSASPEQTVVESTALGQILMALPASAAQTLHALAVHGTAHSAAAALGISDRTFRARLSDARARFLILWHEGEEPSAVWRIDRRADRTRTTGHRLRGGGRRILPAHGTATRYGNHGCRCRPCSAAFSAATRARRAALVGQPTRRITAVQFAALSADRAEGMAARQLAVKYGIGPGLVLALLRGERTPWPEAAA